MDNVNLFLPLIGAACFGAVIGWMVNHILVRAKTIDIKWLASLIGVIAGGAVLALFEPKSVLFGAYCVGLAVAFFGRVFLLSVAKVIPAETIKGQMDKESKNDGVSK